MVTVQWFPCPFAELSAVHVTYYSHGHKTMFFALYGLVSGTRVDTAPTALDISIVQQAIIDVRKS